MTGMGLGIAGWAGLTVLLLALSNHADAFSPVHGGLHRNFVGRRPMHGMTATRNNRAAPRMNLDPNTDGMVGSDQDALALMVNDPVGSFQAVGGNKGIAARKKDLTREILSFSLPVLGSVLVEPVLTLVDTWFIGNKLPMAMGDIGLAALAANCALFNLITTALSFFCTATTSVVASNSERDPEVVGRSIVNGVFLSTVVGTVIAAGLMIARTSILSSGFHVAPRTVKVASDYLMIRALSVPATLANYVGTGACLGVGDTKTPLYGIIAATIANVVGDWFCVCVLGWGVAGAAVATSVSSYVGALVTIQLLRKKVKTEWRGVPKLAELKPFLSVSGALLLSAVLVGFTYSMTTTVANSGGIIAEAASHQIALQTWWLFSFICIPLSLAAQSIAPREIAADRSEVAESLVNKLLGMSVVLSGVVGVASWAIPTYCPGTFTRDIAVAASLRSITFKSVLSQVLMTVNCPLDGINIGCGRILQHISAGVLSSLAAWVVFSQGVGLQQAWTAMLVFAIVRTTVNVLSLPSLYKKLRRSRAEAGVSVPIGAPQGV